MSDTSRRPTHPCLASIAEAAHHSANPPGASIICVDLGPQDVAIGHWQVPHEFDHPLEALIGIVAPDHWDAIGLTCETSHHDFDVGNRVSGQTTVLADRRGSYAGVVDDGLGTRRTIVEASAGVVTDALLRVLGLPTPDPAVGLGYLVESAWLDAIAAVVFGQPGAIRCWGAVADLHPLATAERPGEPGVCLSVAVQALQTESSWARMLQLWATNATTARHQPPDMKPVPIGSWFDEGSFARWTMRDLPVPEDLLPAVLDDLPDAIGGELLDSLVTVGNAVASGHR